MLKPNLKEDKKLDTISVVDPTLFSCPPKMGILLTLSFYKKSLTNTILLFQAFMPIREEKAPYYSVEILNHYQDYLYHNLIEETQRFRRSKTLPRYNKQVLIEKRLKLFRTTLKTFQRLTCLRYFKSLKGADTSQLVRRIR